MQTYQNLKSVKMGGVGKLCNRLGFTLVELLVVIAISAS